MNYLSLSLHTTSSPPLHLFGVEPAHSHTLYMFYTDKKQKRNPVRTNPLIH